MKNAIHEYLDLSNEEKKDLWDKATFVFDTNVFLNLYRYSKKTRETMFKAFADLKDRIWMPNHVAHEIMNNRCEVIAETCDRYDLINKEIENFITKCKEGLRLTDQDQEITDLQKYLTDWLKQNQKKNQLVKNFSDDAVLEQLLTVFDGKVGNALDEKTINEIKNEGEKRFEQQIPPGYKDYNTKTKGEKDNNAFGDLIVWKEILDFSAKNEKDIIYVTNDKKEDWWYSVKGKTVGPRIELKKEFGQETSRKFHMYTMSSFISLYDDSNDNKIEEKTKDEIELFSRVIRRLGSRQELKAYYDSLEDDDVRRIAKIKYKILKLEKKNEKRENAVLKIKISHPDWKQNEDLLQLIQNNEDKILHDKNEIKILQEKLNYLE